MRMPDESLVKDLSDRSGLTLDQVRAKCEKGESIYLPAHGGSDFTWNTDDEADWSDERRKYEATRWEVYGPHPETDYARLVRLRAEVRADTTLPLAARVHLEVSITDALTQLVIAAHSVR